MNDSWKKIHQISRFKRFVIHSPANCQYTFRVTTRRSHLQILSIASAGEIDSADAIVRRVEMTLEHLAAERITINPDCGVAPGSAAVVSGDEVY